jgi:hypothetical protein
MHKCQKRPNVKPKETYYYAMGGASVIDEAKET